jgi:hypothetical protein
MSRMNTGGRRGLAAAAVLAGLLTVAACGNQTAPVTDLDGAVPGNAPSVSQEGRSSKSLDADARRRARGMLRKTAPEKHAPSGMRVSDARP